MQLPDKSNSKPEAPKKKITPVTSAIKAQRPASRRVSDFLFAESPKDLGARIGRDVIVPRLKAGAEEALNSFISGMFWGNQPRPMSNMVRGAVLRGGATNYSGVSTNPVSAILENASPRSVGYQDLVVPSMQEAEMLLASMFELLNEYRAVAVADLYELAQVTSSTSDNGIGWTNLDGARISKQRNGYVLELPRPVRL